MNMEMYWYDEAQVRVTNDDDLYHYYDDIFDDMIDTDWEWIATSDRDDILKWCVQFDDTRDDLAVLRERGEV